MQAFECFPTHEFRFHTAAADQDMVAYTFHKFSEKWRDFELPMPSEEECQHLTLPMLQLFFTQVWAIPLGQSRTNHQQILAFLGSEFWILGALGFAGFISLMWLVWRSGPFLTLAARSQVLMTSHLPASLPRIALTPLKA